MRALIALFVGLLAIFGGSPWTYAQERSRLPRVGYLALGRAFQPTVFVQRMRELGYAEGQTVTFEYRFAEGRHERLLPLARELVESRVDVIFAVGDEAIAAAQRDQNNPHRDVR